MIDPITQHMLEEEQLNILEEILSEKWMDPAIYGSHTASQFGIKWRAFNLATVDMSKFNAMVSRIVKAQSKRAYKAGMIAGDAKAIKAGVSGSSFKGLATAMVAAAVITIAYQGYKRFLSKAARACKHKKGDDKTSCMNRYRQDAMKKQVSDLEKGFISCNKTMEVYDCKDKIKAKIRKIKTKLGEL
jgi:tetrahydromethanopterin S-methyltransferase subunit F